MSWWVCGFLLIISLDKSSASSFREADSLFSAGLYHDAQIAYEFIAFENQDNELIIANALLKKANCLKAENHSDKVFQTLSRCKIDKLDDSLKANIYFEQSLSAFNAGNFNIARKTIEPLLSLNTNREMDLASVFLCSLILDELGEWAISKNNLISYLNRDTTISQSLKDSLKNNISLIYNPDLYPRLKKIKKARLLSMILPGSGQLYSGKPWKGVVAFGLVALSGAYVYYDIVSELYLAAAVGFYLGETFYVGNVNQVNAIIIKRNQHKIDHFNVVNKSELSQFYKKISHL